MKKYRRGLRLAACLLALATCAVLLCSCLHPGKADSYTAAMPVPASVYGLVLLLAALTAGVVKLEQVKETGTYLTGIFPLLFVPAAAGIMELWAEMGQLLLPILIAILPVTVLVMAAAGRTTQALTARNKKEEADHD